MKKWWDGLSNPMKAALNTMWQAFVASFLPQLLGFTAQVAEWAGDPRRDFPSISPLGKAAVAALVAAIAFVVTLLYRLSKSKNPVYPPAAP